MSTYRQSDPCTDLILDFIAGGVPGNPAGESFGNYNAYFGNARSEADLATWSLEQIYSFQAELLARNHVSTAMGRYQLLRATLRRGAAKFSLGPGELFTPALQDKLAVWLLVGRGYASWWRGGMSDDEFASGLSYEWASLPDPANSGRSHYDGDSAGNHASTSLEQVRLMLTHARELMPDTAEAKPGEPNG